ncbi:hypothetical protein ACFFRH_11445 [Streptosporangium vulgare]|uniref:Uncharacterized protein n=1 Tax=Streptosporangium vulgare TaxID=46190 RepID=A0ABV5TD93_9ACTN
MPSPDGNQEIAERADLGLEGVGGVGQGEEVPELAYLARCDDWQ